MLTEELLDLVHTVVRQKAESQTLEVKAAHLDCPKRLYDTLSSFSNQDSGGVLLFGLDERQGFQVVGVYDLQDLQKKVTEQCGQMEPPVRAVFTIAEADGLPVCAAEIPAVDLSERPIQRADLSTLHQDALQRYLLDRRVERPGFGRLDEAQQMEMLNITRDGVPTLAAVLNFGVYPQGYLPQLGITAVVVPGREIGETAQGDDARFLDNKRIEGTIAEMVEEALAFCKRNMKTRTIIDPQTGRRTDQTEYPISALREAILNALIHRDYSIYTEGTPVQLDFFTDRLEIHSPGSLYGRTTVEQLGHSRPDLRNPALAVMAEILTDAENRYSGIPTIRREMAAYGLPAPVFENRRGEFVVILFNGTGQAETPPPADIPAADGGLLAFCATPRTRQEIADFLGIKTVSYAIRHYVAPLIEAGSLKMTLPDRPGSPRQKYYSA